MKHVYIIAEAGVNHNGRLDLALQLCDAAKSAGVDAVKFQTWKTEKIATRSAPLATYQEENIKGDSESQFEMLKKLELSYNNFRIIKEYCEKIEIQFLSTPDEDESLDFLVNLGLPLIKISSGEVTNIPFLRKIASKHRPTILSTGMSNINDVQMAYQTLVDYGASDISLLHCTTNYPCPYDEVNLKAMQTMKQIFPQCTVGYSDHTMGIEVPIAAVAMGAEIIEKHFTLDKTLEGPDHKASLEPNELKAMVDAIRHIEISLGDGVKRPNKSELEVCKVVQKSIVAKSQISVGDELNESNLTVKRIGGGISASRWDEVIGQKAKCNYKIDEAIEL